MFGRVSSLIGGAGFVAASRCRFSISPFQITTSPGRSDSKEKSIIHLDGFAFHRYPSVTAVQHLATSHSVRVASVASLLP